MKVDLKELSKTVSHALRHEPALYNIKLDKEGWVNLADLVNTLREKGLNITSDDVIQMIEKSEKKRHEIIDNRIRAYYGHSTNDKIVKQPHTPPEILYHGTIKENLTQIMESGLLPMQRQYVHLSIDKATAEQVAARKKGDIIILTINALQAHSNGIAFYEEKNNIWLADSIPANYIAD